MCPQVMAIGVTYDEFWHGEPEIVRYAIETEEITARNHAIRQDLLAWNTGRYVMLGVGVVLSQAFSKTSSATYPNEPLLASELDERLAAQKKDREVRAAHTGFLALAAAMQQRNQIGTDAAT